MAYVMTKRETKPYGPLDVRIFPIASNAAMSYRSAILTIPFDFAGGDKIDESLENLMHHQFNAEIETGLTYPYEHTLSLEGFRAYFLPMDLVLGIFLTREQTELLQGDFSTEPSSFPSAGRPVSFDKLSKIGLGKCQTSAVKENSTSIDASFDLSNWKETYAFSYYIKPNYPGRSSHLCNGGFIVSAASRGTGVGMLAGRSFLYYGPGCGYHGSVFNLVYVTNLASVRIWERLGFQSVGLVPRAGRLKTKDGGDEEYVDARVVYGDFKKIGTFVRKSPLDGE